jgi:hypothetical protein
LVERLVRNEKVRGSNPLTSTSSIVLVLVIVLDFLLDGQRRPPGSAMANQDRAR